MTGLLLKVLLAPTLVVLASLVTRRFGPAIGGLFAGIPMVAGPALLIVAIDHDAEFAGRAATATLLGIAGVSTFFVVYGRLARRHGWVTCLLVGWSLLVAINGVLSAIDVGRVPALAVALMAFVAVLSLLPRPRPGAPPPGPPPPWDLPLRAACALGLVLLVAALSDTLGARVSGMLAGFPILASVLIFFTHAQDGPDAVLQLIRGLTWGLISFTAFLLTLSLALPELGTAASFGLAVAAVIAMQLVTLPFVRAGAASVGRTAPPPAAP